MDTKYLLIVTKWTGESRYSKVDVIEFNSLIEALKEEREFKKEFIHMPYSYTEIRRKDEKEFTEEENLIIYNFFNCFI